MLKGYMARERFGTPDIDHEGAIQLCIDHDEVP